jgi:DNA helicase II / ATP-dependent DNA helicase PcrA
MEHILEFELRYPGAKTIVLERNYRSTRTLVEAANRVIEKNVKRKEKRSTTDNPLGEPIRLSAAVSADEEARWIARQARVLIEQGEAPESVAVLFRTNFQSRALEEGFLREGVPYKLLGTRFFERKEVKDALAWMRLAIDPTREADKIRATGAPPRGIGKVTLAKLAAGQREALKPAESAKVAAFERVIEELAAAAETLLPSEFVKLVIEKSGMREKLFDEGDEGDRERFENVVELAAVAVRHDGMRGKEGIAAFLAESALAGDQDDLDRPARDGGEKRGVALMTVHAAKGLEFETVFVAGLEEGLFPHAGMGGNEDRDEEEERRLFYVAITRAKRRLFLTFARMRTLYGEAYLTEPSSFLQDIDPALMTYDTSDGEAIIEI